jgi:cytochrome c556
VKNADWLKFVQELHAAGMTAYKAAQSKNQDNIITAADEVTMACSNCHEKYRRADRCK